MNVPTEAL